MKKLIILCSTALTLLSLISGCAPHPEPGQGPKPQVGIMVPSDTVEAGTGILISGSTKPNQKVWAEVRFGEEIQVGNALGKQGLQDYAEASENGEFYLGLWVPKDVSPGDYEVKIYMGGDFEDRHLFTKLPIHVKAKGIDS